MLNRAAALFLGVVIILGPDVATSAECKCDQVSARERAACLRNCPSQPVGSGPGGGGAGKAAVPREIRE